MQLKKDSFLYYSRFSSLRFVIWGFFSFLLSFVSFSFFYGRVLFVSLSCTMWCQEERLFSLLQRLVEKRIVSFSVSFFVLFFTLSCHRRRTLFVATTGSLAEVRLFLSVASFLFFYRLFFVFHLAEARLFPFSFFSCCFFPVVVLFVSFSGTMWCNWRRSLFFITACSARWGSFVSFFFLFLSLCCLVCFSVVCSFCFFSFSWLCDSPPYPDPSSFSFFPFSVSSLFFKGNLIVQNVRTTSFCSTWTKSEKNGPFHKKLVFS